MLNKHSSTNSLRKKLFSLNEFYLKLGVSENDLRLCLKLPNTENTNSKKRILSFRRTIFVIIPVIFILIVYAFTLNESFYGVRCLIPNNYLIWEATRPISDCAFCKDMNAPIILNNISREPFKEYAYSSKPIIVKGAVRHWKALTKFDYDLFKNLYKNIEGSYASVDEGCQFLNFKSDLFSLKEVFEMPIDRAKNLPGQRPWYVGWGNCHPKILEFMRRFYSIPEFLPEDAEFPNAENIFFGYEIGAVMHLDYIPRLMWQGQVKGNKTWSLVPIPECENVCQPFEFYVEPGDIVLLDTRIWYHATRIPPGQFSLTVQSEYG